MRGLTVIPLTPEVIHLALDLCAAGGVTRQRYCDLQLAALMLREKIPLVLTENEKDFSGIGGVRAWNPF
ncbi:MAG: hypothetical protein JJU00_17485 [Opitutales bacterium]|nr:hypothetical protein [Opitutales bacterium]